MSDSVWRPAGPLATVGLALLAVLAAGADAEAQGRRDRGGRDGGPAAGPPNVATIVTSRGRDIENVEVQEEKFARIRYRPRGGRIDEVAGEDVDEVRYQNPPPVFATGTSQLRAGLYPRAVTSFTAARNAAEANSWVWFHATYRLGEAHLLGGNGAEAAKEFERLLERDAEHFLAPRAINGLGRALLIQGQRGPASAAFNRIESGFGGGWSVRARLGLGDVALSGSDAGGARTHYALAQDRAGVRYPDLARAARVGIGQCYIADRRWDDAIRHFDGILGQRGVAPDVAGDAWVGKGDSRRAQAEERSGDAARPLLKEALIAYLTCAVRYAGTPEAYPKALYKSALIYEQLGLGDLAEKMREELRSRCPNSPWTEKLKK